MRKLLLLIAWSCSASLLSACLNKSSSQDRDRPRACASCWRWENPLPQGNNLTDLWVSTGQEAFAVGSVGAIAHFDGRSWTLMDSATMSYLFSVWGSSSRDVFAAGGEGTILHYDGTSWSAMEAGTTSCIDAIGGSSGRDVYAAAEGGVILHFDGVEWSQVEDIEVELPTSLEAIWVSAPDDVYIVGGDDGPPPGVILHYNGASWTARRPGTSLLRDVWGNSAHEVFAVGSRGEVLRLDGASWSELGSGTTERLSGIWCSSSTDIFATSERGAILHYDGLAWTTMVEGVDSIGAWLSAVSGNAHEVFAVGASGKILRYGALGWVGMVNGPRSDLTDVWGPSGSDLYAVGDDGPDSEYGDGGAIVHFDGQRWAPVELLAPVEPLQGLWGSSRNDIFAVGLGGTIVHFDGLAWTSQESPTESDLKEIWGSSADDVFAIGHNEILHFDGASWSVVYTESGYSIHGLRGLWGSSGEDVFVGSNETILHYDGQAWSRMSLPLLPCEYCSVAAIWGTSASAVYAAVNTSYGSEDSFSVFRYYGVSWTELASGLRGHVDDLSGRSANDVVVLVSVGGTTDDGVVLSFDGASWSEQKLQSQQHLWSLWVDPRGGSVVVGEEGAILRQGYP